MFVVVVFVVAVAAGGKDEAVEPRSSGKTRTRDRDGEMGEISEKETETDQKAFVCQALSHYCYYYYYYYYPP